MILRECKENQKVWVKHPYMKGDKHVFVEVVDTKHMNTRQSVKCFWQEEVEKNSYCECTHYFAMNEPCWEKNPESK